MGRNLYKLINRFDDVIITLIYDVIKMRQLKSRSAFAEYLKNGSSDFHQSYVMLRQSPIVRGVKLKTTQKSVRSVDRGFYLTPT